ncbi:hypothetical protein WNY37_00460 [Henriciella sp. AS95]|uniref:hypothetical protein n=1 Tax=Henriciella sp. AS95 TaxID=3135782 RepID=UPI00317E313A
MRIRFGIAALLGAGIAVAGCDLRLNQDAEDKSAPPEVSEQPAETELAETPVEPETTSEAAPAESETVRPAAVAVKAEIDWEAARTDLASSPPDDDSSFNIQSGSTAPPVPVLLPTGPVRPAGASDGQQPQFRPVPDGYFAVFPGAEYNLIVNGTNLVTDIPGEANDESEDMKFAETTTGAIVSFSRYGADYMVEFECLGSGAEGGDCVTEEEALAVAEEIVISGTQ